MTDDYDTFRAGLTWRPIAEYDRDQQPLVLLRAGEQEAFGFYGPSVIGYHRDDQEADLEPMWRHAQEWQEEQPLPFEPTEFAEVDDKWRVHLMAD